MKISDGYLKEMQAAGSMQLVAADIGGTNSRFARFTAFPLRMAAQCIVPSAAKSFAEVLEAARRQSPEVFAGRAACFAAAVAGPVASQESVTLTNVPYAIQRQDLLPYADKVLFLNDFEAQTRACATEVLREALPVLTGGDRAEKFSAARLDAGVAVIGAGTGLGMAYCLRTGGRPAEGAAGLRGKSLCLRADAQTAECDARVTEGGHELRTGGRLLVLPSEGGHALFAFHDGPEQDLAAFVRKARQRRAVYSEDVLSGRGLSTLHEFLTGKVRAPKAITAAPDFADSETCAWFARLYGRACRHLALYTLPLGGVVVTGGVAGRCPALVRHVAFREEFLSVSPPQDAVLARIPLWLNCDDTAGLWGAAQAAGEAVTCAGGLGAHL